jgi:hypothetical protein
MTTHPRQTLPLWILLLAFACPVGSLMAEPARSGNPAPAISSGEADASLANTIRANPKSAPRTVADAIGTRANGCADSPGLVAEAIKALPEPVSKRLVADIVYHAVQSCPDSVLAIVDSAVSTAPATAAEEIVAAAVSAVPDPYKLVSMPAKNAARAQPVAGDFKSTQDGKSIDDGKAGPYSADRPQIPLADAIVQTANNAREGLSIDALAAAADYALKFGVDKALAALDDPRLLFGVGDAGLTNFENEPRRAVSGGEVPTPTPRSTPPPVSQ